MEAPKRKLEKVDTYIIFACIFFLCASFGILTKNYLFNNEGHLGNVRIGKISVMKNNVRRKFESGMMWYDAKKETALFENDWIYTGENSTVTISFDDGGELVLDPNSLVVLTRSRGLMKLELQHGSFVADLKKGSEITLVKNGKTETIKTEDKKIKVSGQAEQIAEVIEEAPQADEEEFKGLEFTVENSYITPTSPKLNTRLLVNSRTADIPFEWKASEGFEEFNLEISQSEDFSKPIVQVFENDFGNMIVPFKGKVYWRVSAQAQDGPVTSEILSFTIKQNTAPLAKFPKDKESVTTKISKDQEPYVEFEWKDKEEVWVHYEIQVSKDENFAEETTFAHDNLLGESNRIPVAEKGTYFWRLRGKDESGEQYSNWSPTRSFNFNIAFNEKLAGVDLKKKNVTYYLNRDDYKIIDAERIANLSQKTNKPKIEWDTKTPASFYKVEISNTDDFSDIIEQIDATENQAEFSKTRFGKSFYRVTPQFENGDTAKPSYGTIKTYLPPPKILSSKEKDKSFNISWSASPAIDKYEVVYYDHPSEQERQVLYFKSNEVKIKNSNGFLSWKVRAVDSKTREPLTHYTDIKKITAKVLASVPDKAEEAGKKFPLIVSPPKKKTFLTFDSNPTFVVMRWKYSEKYTQFELEISASPLMDYLLLTRKVSKKKTVIRRTFKPGKYYFRVRAINDGEAGEWSPTQVFRMIQNTAE